MEGCRPIVTSAVAGFADFDAFLPRTYEQSSLGCFVPWIYRRPQSSWSEFRPAQRLWPIISTYGQRQCLFLLALPFMVGFQLPDEETLEALFVASLLSSVVERSNGEVMTGCEFEDFYTKPVRTLSPTYIILKSSSMEANCAR